MENKVTISYGSSLVYEGLPKDFQKFWDYLNDFTSLADRTIKNYVNSINQLFAVGSQEFNEKPEVGSEESLDMINRIIELDEFTTPIFIGTKETKNYDEMNSHWQSNYSAAYNHYNSYINFLAQKSFKPELPNVYAIRTKEEENVVSIQTPDKTFEFGGIYNYQQELKEADVIFSVLGGDKPAWDTGFQSIAKISTAPFDYGYNKTGRTKYFKIGVTNHLVFDQPLTRDDFFVFPDTINASFIGPTTKGEANQAIRKLDNEHVLGIIHGIIDYYPEYYENLVEIFSEEIVSYATNNTVKLINPDVTEKSPTIILPPEDSYLNKWEQKIFYGAPGTGKSYKMKQEYPDFKRVTFHPEYTFTDFVGGLRPVQEETISYQFVSGPLTDSIIEALISPDKEIGIIIEEINRGNTAAIFGDMFQLLDRDSDGWSEYGIVNKDVIDYLYSKGIDVNEIKFPSNLSIIATMNNADQGIYVMDSAFKRRWEFEYIPTNFKDSKFKDELVAGMGIKWKDFGTILNDHLSSNGVEEDKLIGQYFLRADEITSKKKVASKLFIYLWDDVVRYNREVVFSKTNNFSELLETYMNKGTAIFAKPLKEKIDGVSDE